ncbi:YxcD family protein [Virgibacillus halophilus]|uniref:YxcD family protein n=1 Tax=Tigheibacillus halophilus TaxID=361280 RepID=A0ABU5CA09_9BACI|nr:YxcD family protein [Virgibacillus halophilus]
MAKLILSEQDIINALCVYTARNKQIAPEQVEAELIYDEDTGFSAEVCWANRKQVLIMVNLVEALRLWLKEYMNEDPFLGIKLELDENQGIIAFVG